MQDKIVICEAGEKARFYPALTATGIVSRPA
jgi:hypothetical protein